MDEASVPFEYLFFSPDDPSIEIAGEFFPAEDLSVTLPNDEDLNLGLWVSNPNFGDCQTSALFTVDCRKFRTFARFRDTVHACTAMFHAL